LKQKTTEAFAAVVQKSQELDVFNPCTAAALEMLRTKYAPERFPRMHEDVFELKPDAERPVSFGGDLITSIQTVPGLTAEKAAELRTKTNEVSGRDVASTSPELDPKNDAPPPRAAQAPPPKEKEVTRPAPKPTPAPAPAAATSNKNKNTDAEPEDTL
jgi:hypothetical protein